MEKNKEGLNNQEIKDLLEGVDLANKIVPFSDEQIDKISTELNLSDENSCITFKTKKTALSAEEIDMLLDAAEDFLETKAEHIMDFDEFLCNLDHFDEEDTDICRGLINLNNMYFTKDDFEKFLSKRILIENKTNLIEYVPIVLQKGSIIYKTYVVAVIQDNKIIEIKEKKDN